MSCPFLAAAAASGEANDASRPAGGCPFAKRFGLLGSSPSDPATQRDLPVAAAAAADGTGEKHKSGPRNSVPDVVEGRADRSGAADGGKAAGEIGGESGRKAAAGRCPYGFDSAADGRMAAAVGPMSCVLCKALLFDPARCDPCKHVYCRGCIARFTDCPLCGCDVKALLPDATLTHAVDAFISAHVLHRPALLPPSLAAPRSEPPPNALDAAASAADLSGKDASAAADTEATDSAAAAAAAAAAATAAAEREAEAARVETEALDLDKASPGSFLFIHAMRAMQHGNLPSARARFALSAFSLKSFLSPGNAASVSATADAAADAARGVSSSSSAGTVSCSDHRIPLLPSLCPAKRPCPASLLMSDVASAASSYQEAVDVLSAALPALGKGETEAEGERAVEEGQQQGLEMHGGGDSDSGAVDDEVGAWTVLLHHALCVTLNKLGDLHYRSDHLPEALALYQRALARRQHALARTEACAQAREGEGAVRETASKALDVAVSTAKVADVQQALGEEESAREGFSRALRLVQAAKETLSAAAAAAGQGDCLALLDKVRNGEARGMGCGLWLDCV
ncbi:unnamed protein product [Closterium sp. Naga37s-1]|nr:unnamed protein product [Closterium sp. Naga37s-1]